MSKCVYIFWATLYFDQKYRNVQTHKKFTKRIDKQTIIWGGEILLNLQAGHLDHHTQYPTIQLEMYQCLKMAWRNQALMSGETETSSSPSESPHSKYTHDSLPSCCSMLFRINVVKYFDASVNGSTLLSQHRNSHSPLFRLGKMFNSFFSFKWA